MEYSIQKLSQLAGVSARTLRYYDSIGLLKPSCISDSGYRYYGENELGLLQQILFFKERGFELQVIRDILYQESFDTLQAMHEHLTDLVKERERLNMLITNVEKTIETMKGNTKMSDQEKFEAFKNNRIQENEEKYGKEARERYGDERVSESNRKMLSMTKEEYDEFVSLEEEIKNKLKSAVESGETPEGEAGRQIMRLHKKWLMKTWKEYSEEAHKGVAQMYAVDERFTAYYDAEVRGCACFLNAAIQYWSGR